MTGPLPIEPWEYPSATAAVIADVEYEQAKQEAERLNEKLEALQAGEEGGAAEAPKPVSFDDRSKNPLRPRTWDEIIGQEKAKAMMQRMVERAALHNKPLDHVLLVGPAGTGKTTFSQVIAEEMGVDCYQIAAPVTLDQLLALRETMNERDILFVDEIHQQAIAERRGSDAQSSPEVWLQLLEDFVLATSGGMLEFPRVTIIGATTDPGRLPDPFLDRFPLQPRLEHYSVVDLGEMAVWNTSKLGLQIELEAAHAFAKAARRTPRIVNRYIRNANSLVMEDNIITQEIAEEVLFDLNGVAPDGLDRSQQDMLKYLYQNGRREMRDGEVRYQASVGSIATGIGLSRDQKAVQLRVEPYLITEGFVQVSHGGRTLTERGVERAQQLLGE